MTELEKKLLLTKDEYDYLMEYFCKKIPLVPTHITKQTNYYFDTDDLSMNRKNITCRVRLKNGQYKGTMKQHFANSDQSTETEIKLYEGINKNAFTDMGLKLQGELITERCTVFKHFGCEVVLDKNAYLGHIDYELEIEYTPEHEKNAQTIMHIILDMLIRRKCFLVYKDSYINIQNVQSKAERFFERKSSTCRKGEKAMDENIYEESDEIKEADIMSSYDEVDTLEHPDPDEYMNNYFASDETSENMCKSCIHFNGTTCELNSISCEYEHR